jgi:hypothetical protein
MNYLPSVDLIEVIEVHDLLGSNLEAAVERPLERKCSSVYLILKI